MSPLIAYSSKSFSTYHTRGLVNPAPGEFDFDGFRALDPLFKLAMKTGLWVVLRPGVRAVLIRFILACNLLGADIALHQCRSVWWWDTTLGYIYYCRSPSNKQYRLYENMGTVCRRYC